MNLFSFRAYRNSVPPGYTAVALLPLSGNMANLKANPIAINNAAVVGGHAPDANGNIIATRWTLTSPRHLGTFGGASSNVFGINDIGATCGSADTADGSVQAALWEGGLIRNLGTIFGATGSSVAYALVDGPNSAVFGISSDAAGMNRAVRWDNLVIQQLLQENHWVSSTARAVGPNGFPAGSASLQSGPSVAVYWNPSPVLLNGLPGSSNAEVLAGRASGVMVGQSNTGSNTTYEAVFFQEGVNAFPMQTIAGATASCANGVNRHSVAVGEYTRSGGLRRGFVFARYGGASMVDLSLLLTAGGPVTEILNAYDINDDGMIAALGRDANGNEVGVLLLPN